MAAAVGKVESTIRSLPGYKTGLYAQYTSGPSPAPPLAASAIGPDGRLPLPSSLLRPSKVCPRSSSDALPLTCPF